MRTQINQTIKSINYLGVVIEQEHKGFGMGGHVDIYRVIDNGQVIDTITYDSEYTLSSENLDQVKTWIQLYLSRKARLTIN